MALFKAFIWPILRLACISALVGGVFLWLEEAHQVYVDRHVAVMIGIVETTVTQAPDWVWWVLVGLLGLVGMVAWEFAAWLRRRRSIQKQGNDQRYPPANLDEWRADILLLWQAGCLWKGISPRHPVEFENPAYPAFSRLLLAAERGELKLAKREPDPNFASSHVTKQALYEYAKKKNDVPEFLKHIEDINNDSPYISMKEATTRAYEETEGTLVANFSESPLSNGRKKVLSWYAHALVGSNRQTPIFGKSPPSRIRRQIPPDEFKRCRFSDDVQSLIRNLEEEPKFVELEIRQSDFLKRLDEIKRWSGD